MKISELIKEIVTQAEIVYGVTDHINDCISVSMYYNPSGYEGEWQVWLTRPSQDQLDCGEIENINTIKISKENQGLSTVGNSLHNALSTLFDKVVDCEPWG